MPPPVFVDGLAEMEEILKDNTLGYLGVILDAKPYVVPLNYSYAEGKLLFHCAHDGWKLDAIRANPEVCFAIGTQEGEVKRHASHAKCHVDSDSVICFGTARIIDDVEERTALLNEFQRAYDPGHADLTPAEVQRCACVAITVREMTGRHERDHKRTLWRHVF